MCPPPPPRRWGHSDKNFLKRMREVCKECNKRVEKRRKLLYLGVERSRGNYGRYKKNVPGICNRRHVRRLNNYYRGPDLNKTLFFPCNCKLLCWKNQITNSLALSIQHKYAWYSISERRIANRTKHALEGTRSSNQGKTTHCFQYYRRFNTSKTI